MADNSKSVVSNNAILNSEEYKNLPIETQLKLTELMLNKKIELTMTEQEYLREHLSSNRDTLAYLDFLAQQNAIQRNAKGVNVTYNSYETKTPTGKISSKTTTATASSGCLLPIVCTLLMIALVSI